MRFACLCFVVAFAVLGLSNSALGIILSAGGRISGFAVDNRLFPDESRRMTCSVVACEASLSNPGMFPNEVLDFALDGEVSWGGAIATAHVNAHAAAGDLGINIVGGAVAPDRAIAEMNATTIEASWKDVVVFSTPRLAFTDTVRVHSFLSLDGELIGNVSSEAKGSVQLLLTDISSFPALPPPPNLPADQFWGSFHESPSEDIHTSEEIPGAIRMVNVFRNGVGADLGYQMILSGRARSDADAFSSFQGQAGSAIIVANVSGSLHWGGIEKVTDEFGNLIDDWTITSESGFDYSKPFGVPEPSSMLLLATALCARLALSWRRRSTR
jgi:hypothetical protein